MASAWEVLEDSTLRGVRVRAFLSKRTGIRLCLADVEGPLVSAFVAVATEAVTNDYAHCDDGLPHTLEHLVFLGSEQYPYKGVLDQLANRCLAEGTNAWTATDHTAYQLVTAGSAGFLNLLPIYLDHILYPTLTDSGFVTEVHHVSGEGKDAGVVYCEMQARENTVDDICEHAVRRALFPGGSGYASETGGILRNLRGLGVDAVRRYHAEYYRPDNMCVIVVGQVDVEELLGAMESTEARVSAKGSLPAMPGGRPWASPVPPLPPAAEAWRASDRSAGSVGTAGEPRALGLEGATLALAGGGGRVATVPFPTEDEEPGQVVVAWRGPDWGSFEEFTALAVLLRYLTHSSVSPLHKVFVESKEAPCANVMAYLEEQAVCYSEMTFYAVDAAKLGRVRELLFRTLRRVAGAAGAAGEGAGGDGDGAAEAADDPDVNALVPAGIDMKRMAMIVARERRRVLNLLEVSAHDVVATCLIADFLYGDTLRPATSAAASPATEAGGGTLRRRLDIVGRLDALPVGEADAPYWQGLLKRWLLDEAQSVTVVAQPSQALAERNAAEETARVDRQRAELGEAGLAARAAALKTAQAANDVPPPAELLTAVPLPDVDSVPHHPVVTALHACIPSHAPAAEAAPARSGSDSEGDGSPGAAAASVGVGGKEEPSGPEAPGSASVTLSASVTSVHSAGMAAATAARNASGGSGASTVLSASTSSAMSWQVVDESEAGAAGIDMRVSPTSSEGGADARDDVHGWETRVAVSVANRARPSETEREAAAVRAALAADGLRPGALPFSFQWDHVHSAFVRVSATLDTSTLPDRLRPLCDLFVAALFELPVLEPAPGDAVDADAARGGRHMGHEEVINQLVSDSVSYSASVGMGGRSFSPGAFSQLLVVQLKFEGPMYAAAAAWLRRTLLSTRFTAERLRVVVQKLLGNVPSAKRSGSGMARALLRDSLFHPTRSNVAALNVVRQQRFLTAVAARLETDPAAVVAELEEFRAYVTRPGCMRVHVACNIVDVPRPVRPWVDEFGRAFASLASDAARRPPVTPHAVVVPFLQDYIRADARLGDPVGSAAVAAASGAAAAASAAAVAAAADEVGTLGTSPEVGASSMVDGSHGEAAVPSPDVGISSSGVGRGSAADAGAPGTSSGAVAPPSPAQDPDSRDRIAALAAIESSYLYQATACIATFDHADYPALLVAIEYLTALEGDFWRKIRGLGLSYSYGISVLPEQGIVRFHLSESTDLAGAYRCARDIVQGYVDGTVPLDPVKLEAARSTVMFNLIEREDTVAAAAAESFQNALRRLPAGYNAHLVREVARVDPAAATGALRVYIAPLFDPRTSTTAITTGIGTDHTIITSFARDLGRTVTSTGRLDKFFCDDDGDDEDAAVATTSAAGHVAPTAPRSLAACGCDLGGHFAGLWARPNAALKSVGVESQVAQAAVVATGAMLAALAVAWLVRRKKHA